MEAKTISLSDDELNMTLIARLRERRMSWVGAGTDPDPDCAAAADRIEALVLREESITNNNDWFGLHFSLWGWLILQPDMPDIDLLDGGSDEALVNYKAAINALIEARVGAALRKVADKVYAKLSAKGLYAEAQSARDTILALLEKPHDRA